MTAPPVTVRQYAVLLFLAEYSPGCTEGECVTRFGPSITRPLADLRRAGHVTMTETLPGVRFFQLTDTGWNARPRRRTT